MMFLKHPTTHNQCQLRIWFVTDVAPLLPCFTTVCIHYQSAGHQFIVPSLTVLVQSGVFMGTNTAGPGQLILAAAACVVALDSWRLFDALAHWFMLWFKNMHGCLLSRLRCSRFFICSCHKMSSSNVLPIQPVSGPLELGIGLAIFGASAKSLHHAFLPAFKRTLVCNCLNWV